MIRIVAWRKSLESIRALGGKAGELAAIAISDYDDLREFSEWPSIPMLLFCPKCGAQHVDQIETGLEYVEGIAVAESMSWDNPPHRSHLCHSCGHIWRPADVPTTGVAEIQTKGKKDGSPRPQQDDPELDCTDWAHPAWWRGHEHMAAVFCAKISAILDGKDDGAGFGYKPWHGVRQRLVALVKGGLPRQGDDFEPGLILAVKNTLFRAAEDTNYEQSRRVLTEIDKYLRREPPYQRYDDEVTAEQLAAVGEMVGSVDETDLTDIRERGW